MAVLAAVVVGERVINVVVVTESYFGKNKR